MVLFVKDIIVIFRKNKTFLILIFFSRPEKSILYLSLPGIVIPGPDSNQSRPEDAVKDTRSVTMNIFRKKIIFKSFVKKELSYVFTINIFSTAESCMEQ